jgi:hypothetical protein
VNYSGTAFVKSEAGEFRSRVPLEHRTLSGVHRIVR